MNTDPSHLEQRPTDSADAAVLDNGAREADPDESRSEAGTGLGNESRGGRMIGNLACAWGITGVLLLLGTAIVRLSVPALEAFASPLGIGQWLFLAVSVVVMAYAEGVRGFQRSWSPRVAARALSLRNGCTPRQALLAPLFCMGFFDASRRRIITAWCLTFGIIVLVLLVSQLSQPWRGLLDVGVIVGLGWGVTSVVLIFVAALSGRRDTIDPGVPAAP